MIDKKSYLNFLKDRVIIDNTVREIYITYQLLRDSILPNYFKTSKTISTIEYDGKLVVVNGDLFDSRSENSCVKFPAAWLSKPWFDLAKAEVEKEYNDIVMDKLKE